MTTLPSPIARVETLVLTGPASASGTITLTIGNVSYQIGITSADTATVVGTALKAALDNDPALPFTCVHTTGTLVFTAKTRAQCPTQIDFAVVITATGLYLSTHRNQPRIG